MAKRAGFDIPYDDETLRFADREACRPKASCSEFPRTPVRKSVELNQQKSEDEARRERRQAAIKGMRGIARKLGDWPAEQIVHDWRYRLK